MPGVEGAGIPLGVATALLEVNFSELDTAVKQMEQLTRRVRGLQDTLTEGNQALSQSARQVAQQTRQAAGSGGTRQRTSAGQQAAARGAAAEATAAARAAAQAAKAEQQQAQAANQTAAAEEKVTEELKQQNSLYQQLLRARKQARDNLLNAVPEIGTLPGELGFGKGGFGRGNPNIPTFAQFGLFPFAGLAGSFGATGLQQGILGASSALGVAELGSFRNAIVRLGDQLKGLGGIFGSLAQGGSQVAVSLGATSGGLVAALGAVGAVVLPIIGVMAAFAGAATIFSAVVGEMERKVNDVSGAIIEFNRAAGQGQTSGELQQQIGENQRTREGLLISRGELEGILQAGVSGGATPQQNQRLAQLTSGELTDANDFIQRTLISGIIRNLDTEIETLGVTIGTAGVQINSAQTALNDAEAAADRFAQAQAKANQEGRNFTNVQIDQTIRQLAEDYQAINAVLTNTQGLSAEYRSELFGQMDEIQALIVAYQNMKSPIRDFIVGLRGAAEELPKFIKDLAGLITGRGRDLQREQEDFARAQQREEEDANRQRLNQLTDFGRQLQQEDTDRQRQRLQQIEDFERSLAEEREDQQEKVQELTEDYNEETEDAEREHQRKMAEIQREGRIAVLEAATRLDARGVLEAQRRTAEQLRQEEERYQEQQQEREEQFRETLEELEDNLAEQQEKRRRDFERQLQRQDQEFAISRQRKIDDFNRNLQREDQERSIRLQREDLERQIRRQRQQEDFNRQLADLLQHYTNLNQIATNAYSFLQQGWQNFLLGLNPPAPATITATGGGTGSGGGGRVYAPVRSPGFAHGTPFVSSPGMVRVHYGEGILDAFENRAYQRSKMGGMGDASIVVNINGDTGDRSDAQVRSLAKQGAQEALNEYMRQFAAQGLGMLGGKR